MKLSIIIGSLILICINIKSSHQGGCGSCGCGIEDAGEIVAAILSSIFPTLPPNPCGAVPTMAPMPMLPMVPNPMMLAMMVLSAAMGALPGGMKGMMTRKTALKGN